jgi:putative zinc finger/helix-turn-helix YgiT family protein
MTTTREKVPYAALPGTVLGGVEVSRCPTCGEHEVALPAIDQLNRLLAQAVIRKPARLGGGEIRFLRSYLGYSSSEFARAIGSDPATVSRWEGGKKPIGHHVDLLLRAMVAIDKKVDDYGLDEFTVISEKAAGAAVPKPTRKGPAYAIELAAAKNAKTKWRTAKPAPLPH